MSDEAYGPYLYVTPFATVAAKSVKGLKGADGSNRGHRQQGGASLGVTVLIRWLDIK